MNTHRDVSPVPGDEHGGHTPIGTVEILELRVYPLDPAADIDNPRTTTVAVPPGAYPVYRDFDAVYWVMTGRLNQHGLHCLGDGLFVSQAGDRGAGPLLRFPSPRLAPRELAALLASPACQPGFPQRLRFHLDPDLDPTRAGG